MFVKFKGWECIIEGGYYTKPKTRKALILHDLNGSPGDTFVACATVNLPNIDCKENEVFIKDYSENKGIEEALIKAKVIHSAPVSTVSTGYTTVNKHVLTSTAVKKLFTNKKTK